MKECAEFAGPSVREVINQVLLVAKIGDTQC